MLGRLEVLDGGTPIELGAPKQRAVLAFLLLHPNTVVSTDRLVDAVWGDAAPRTAEHSVQIYVSELRKALDGDSERLVTQRPGYELRVDIESIDARRFERLVEDAVALQRNGDVSAASELAGEALGLWRGEPLADFAYEEFARREIERLEELRLRAVLLICEARLDARDPLAAVPLLQDAVTEQPLREEPRRLLMLALFSGGRQAEALREFRRYRELLAAETGLEPSPELLRLEEQILLRDPSISPPVDVREPEHAVARNPYKGLRAFGEDDAADFFGRELLVTELLAAIASPLTAVVGPSGSGKSSAVRAGLIPALRSAAGDEPGRWAITTFMPGRYPFAEFDAAIRRVAGVDLPNTDPSDDGSIARVILRALPPGASAVLVIVDQFEELFTLTDETTRRAFLRNLVTAVDDPRDRIRILLTVRADFYDRPLLYPEFARLFTDNVVNVVPLLPAEIEAAAVGPAQRSGVGFAPNLLAQLVSDMADQPGALPLFQYTLTELFDERGDSLMSLDAYRRIGGIAGALGRRADAVYASLGDAEREATRSVFLRLVKPAEDRYTRRPVPVLELEGAADASAVSTVLTRFGKERLLTFDRDSHTGSATVAVSHEALLVAWGRLAGWLEEARFDLAELDALLSAAAEWETVERDPGYLLTGARLTDYEAWAETTTVTMPPTAAVFLEESVEAMRRAEQAEAERVEREERATRRARVRLWGMLAAIVALAGVTTLALISSIANRPPPVIVGSEGSDGAWEQLMLSGVDRAAADFGIDLDVVYTDGSGVVPSLEEIVDGSPKLVLLGWGSVMDEEVERIVLEHPTIQFVALDFEPGEETIDAMPNTSFSVFKSNEGSFLAGAIAAMKTKSGKIGFIGGVDLPVIWGFQAGFEAGARFVNPDVEVTTRYLSQWPDTSGFLSPTLAAIHAREMYNEGIDIIFPASGDSVIGVAYTALDVTKETGIHRWMIGVDADAYLNWSDEEPIPGTEFFPPYEPKVPAQLQPHVLSSMLKRTDTAMYAALEDYANGTFTPGIRVFGLSNEGIDYSTSGGYVDDIVDDLERIKAGIIAGEIVVPNLPAGGR